MLLLDDARSALGHYAGTEQTRETDAGTEQYEESIGATGEDEGCLGEGGAKQKGQESGQNTTAQEYYPGRAFSGVAKGGGREGTLSVCTI